MYDLQIPFFVVLVFTIINDVENKRSRKRTASSSFFLSFSFFFTQIQNSVLCECHVPSQCCVQY